MHGGVFIDLRICSLPVDVKKLADDAGVHLVKDSDAEVLRGEYGRVFYNGKNWIIVYNDSLPYHICRYTIAHELGHVFLQHQLTKKKYKSMGNGIYKAKRSELHADYFADRLLCPACVLWALELDTPEKIAELCAVDMDVAKRRLKRLEELKKRNRFLTDPLEKELYENFLPFIETVREKQN